MKKIVFDDSCSDKNNEIAKIAFWMISIGSIHFDSVEIKKIIDSNMSTKDKATLLIARFYNEIIDIIDFNTSMNINYVNKTGNC